jgi:hypothetical protein
MVLEGDKCATTYEHAMLSQSYKLAMFILSICHVVLVVFNDPVASPDRHLPFFFVLNDPVAAFLYIYTTTPSLLPTGIF